MLTVNFFLKLVWFGVLLAAPSTGSDGSDGKTPFLSMSRTQYVDASATAGLLFELDVGGNPKGRYLIRIASTDPEVNKLFTIKRKDRGLPMGLYVRTAPKRLSRKHYTIPVTFSFAASPAVFRTEELDIYFTETAVTEPFVEEENDEDYADFSQEVTTTEKYVEGSTVPAIEEVTGKEENGEVYANASYEENSGMEGDLEGTVEVNETERNTSSLSAENIPTQSPSTKIIIIVGCGTVLIVLVVVVLLCVQAKKRQIYWFSPNKPCLTPKQYV